MSIYCNYSVSTNSPESLPGNAVVHLPNILGKQLLFCSICNITFILLKVKVWNIISYFFHIRACLKKALEYFQIIFHLLKMRFLWYNNDTLLFSGDLK